MAKAWHDPRVPADVDCVLRPLLERRAAETPDKVSPSSRTEAPGPIARRARSRSERRSDLRRLGVAAGRHGPVLAAQRPGCHPRLVRAQLSRRGLRADQSRLSRRAARARRRQFRCAAHRRPCRARWPPAEHRSGARGSTPRSCSAARSAAIDGLALPRARRARARATATCRRSRARSRPGTRSRIIYTSGTTGPSKGVMSSYLQLYSMGVESLCLLGPDDRCMVNLPLFHVGGTAAVYAMLAQGRLDRRRRRLRHGALLADRARDAARPPRSCSGVMATFLLEAAARRRRIATTRCAPPSWCRSARTRRRSRERFGCDVYTVFNMTEISTPLRVGARTRRRSAPAAGRAPASTCGSSTTTTARWRPARSAS